MASVLGLGGLFVKSDDPEALRAWYGYARWLGLSGDEHGVMLFPSTMPAGGCTVFQPFPRATNHFAPSEDAFMFNLVVDDLDSALAQVKEGGANVVGGIEEYDYGRFGWFIEPDGHKVELWQPRREQDPTKD
jgi:predicted enzyme related to lactoylglutathione lyase